MCSKVNILQQYRAAVARRGSAEPYSVATHGIVAIGEEFVFGGASWQILGEKITLHRARTSTPVYGYAKIIKIDANGFKIARRVS
jgi:hypothetical protein